MRVLHLIKVTGVAGAERHLLMLLSALRARDVDARLVLLVERNNPVDAMVAEAEKRNIPVERVTIYGHRDILLPLRLRGVIRRHKPDIVHTHLLHADMYGIPAAKLAGVKTVITSRHNDDDFRTRGSIRFINRSLWPMVSAAIAISDAIRKFTIEVEGAPAEKVHTIRYGMEHTSATDEAIRQARQQLRQSLGVEEDTPLVGMACRLVTQKGVNYGLVGFKLVADEFPNAHLVIAGDGPLRQQLEYEARAMDIHQRTHFLGWRDDVPQIMAGLDIFLAPSLWEGFGLVLLEAMSKRLPIIASNVSAIPEVVADGETGILVPPRDSEAIAQALRLLLADKALRRHLGLVGEDRLETHFSVGRMADETLNLYRQVKS